MKKKAHKPPSKIRYDQSHPTVSIRVNRELYDKLKELREQSGKSLGDILREAVKRQKPSTKEAYDLGCKAGYDDAKRKFTVTYRCSVCGGIISLDTVEERRAVSEYMREHGWSHSKCGS